MSAELLRGLDERLIEALKPTLRVIEKFTEQIHPYDEEIEKLAEKYPETKRLRQVSGVSADLHGVCVDAGGCAAIFQEPACRRISGADAGAKGFRGQPTAIENHQGGRLLCAHAAGTGSAMASGGGGRAQTNTFSVRMDRTPICAAGN